MHRLALLCFLVAAGAIFFAPLSEGFSVKNRIRKLLKAKRGPTGNLESKSTENQSQRYGFTALVDENQEDPPITIGSFNIQIFGDTKYSKKDVVKSLLLILPRYDVVLIMEIRDSDGDSFPKFMEDLNRENGDDYDYVVSERLGRSNSKEQYAFVFRKDVFELDTTYQYPDPDDKFERPPYAVVLQSNRLEYQSLALMGIHTKPSDAAAEIDALVDAYEAFQEAHQVENTIIMGDFNGDCNYVTSSDWKDVRLRTDQRFHWLIKDGVDTTVSGGSCAYDRMITIGDSLVASTVPDSAKAYHFEIDQNLDLEMTKDVSDHFPVEVTLYGKLHAEFKDEVSISKEVTLQGYLPEGILELGVQHAELAAYDQTTYGDLTSEADAMIKLNRCGIENLTEEMDNLSNLVGKDLSAAALTYINDAEALKDVEYFPGLIEQPASQFCITIEFMNNRQYSLAISKIVMA